MRNYNLVTDEDCKLFALYNGDVRQSIAVLQNLLAAGVKVGAEYSQEHTYLIEDKIERGIIEQKIMQLVAKL